MNSYTQYIQIDENNNIISAFTSAQEENYKEVNKINIGKGLRQFDFQRKFPKGLMNFETGERNYRWNSEKKTVEEISEDVETITAKKKAAELQELRRKAKEEIFDRFLSEDKFLAEIAEEVKAGLRKKEKDVN